MIIEATLGVASWWAAEYLAHRFLGHRKKSRTEFAIEHRRHHAEGNYFAPTSKKVRAMGPVVLAIGLALWWPLGIGAIAFAAGFTASYVAYEVLHRRLHTHPPRGRYGRWARRHHFFHHFHDPKMNHGVTMSVGDLIFGTQVTPGRIRVPERLAMEWLLDPETGDVDAKYAHDYELVRLPRPSEIRGAEAA